MTKRHSCTSCCPTPTAKATKASTSDPESYCIEIPSIPPPVCPDCGTELAIQMVEHPCGHVCLKCHPPEIK